MPLLHPARALPGGGVRAGAGFSANVATGSMAEALHDAQSVSTAGSAPASSAATLARGALAAAAFGPGLAPWLSAEVGLGQEFEAGLVYSGRSVRADLRHSWDVPPNWVLAIEAAGSAVVGGREPDGTAQPIDLTGLHGWGADVPLVVGYESDGQLYSVWLGARLGWEHVDIGGASDQAAAAPFALSATRFWAGGLIGLAVGFRHVHVAVELDASYASVAGRYNGVDATVQGVGLAPATALWWRF